MELIAIVLMVGVGAIAMLVIQSITYMVMNENNRRYYAKRKRQSFHKGQGMIRI